MSDAEDMASSQRIGFTRSAAEDAGAQKRNEDQSEKKLTAFERLSKDLSNDHRVLKEITLGKRIGFYRIRGELGSGNFSQVKLGIHALTKGMRCVVRLCVVKLHVLQYIYCAFCFSFRASHCVLYHHYISNSDWPTPPDQTLPTSGQGRPMHLDQPPPYQAMSLFRFSSLS